MSQQTLEGRLSKLFPSDVTRVVQGARAITLSGNDIVDRNYKSTSSFFYDPPTLGLKSTQQLNVDWSLFSNHTFFNSAEVKVNVAFDKIINNFPFDGTRKEYENFFENLTGFERYVYDIFPKNTGYLFFNGTWIQVSDVPGATLPDASKTKDGVSVLNPMGNSFSIEMQLFVPTVTNNHQVICQKLSTPTYGFSVILSQSLSTLSCSAVFIVTSGSNNSLEVSAPVNKGQFNHICFVYERDSSNRLYAYINEQLVATTANSILMQSINPTNGVFIIGSGTQVNGATTYTPTQTLSGAIDEFRFFHSARQQEQIQNYARKSIYATPDLVLYYKFNEPTGTLGSSASDTLNRIVLDSSGNSLHAYVSTGFTFSLRSTGSIAVPMTYERDDLSPVLFPAFRNVSALNATLLLSASEYDDKNPNLITKLLPAHYLLEGQAFEGLQTEEGELNSSYGGTSPGNGQLGTTQLILTLLYVWAKFFDELKMHIDAFATMYFVDYNATNTTPDHFLPLVMKQFGFKIPDFFLDASMGQYIDADNVQAIYSNDKYSLQYVQNQILRRVLTNMTEIIRSKGTQHSIKAFLRSVGIDPDNSVRIKEYGGPTKRHLHESRETKIDMGLFLELSGSGWSVQSPYLSSSYTSTGFPVPAGTMTFKNGPYGYHGLSNNPNDGLLTSGSWAYEAFYKWPVGRMGTVTTQSLVRLQVTGSDASNLLFNVVATPSNVTLFGRPTYATSIVDAPLMQLVLTGVNVMDGNIWYVSFGRRRNDEFGSVISSSYFLRAARQSYGDVKYSYVTSTYYSEFAVGSISSCALQNKSAVFNASGSYFYVGSASLAAGTSPTYLYLNATNIAPANARATNFNGMVSRIKFWSKAITDNEYLEHVRNHKSLGAYDPTTNFNFVNTNSGSWGRLRIDAAVSQDAKVTNASGRIAIFDYSQNNMHLSGSGFPASTRVIMPTLWPYSIISPNFDEATTNNKVRVRGYQDSNKLALYPWAQVSPVYEVPPNETPTDDPRFSIEFSAIDALNRDVVNIFATLDSIDNALGDPELLFSPDYPTLETLRNIYFNRLTDKINLKAFFEFYRTFDLTVSNFIEQLIPKKTKFYGTNFVIESHMLERPKFEYNYADAYVNESFKFDFSDRLLLQLVVGVVKKY
jgi:hypothetical protein